MKPLETKTIKLGDKDYPIKKSARAYLKFDEMAGHSIDLFDNSTKDSLYFLYSCFWGGGLRVSFDEFLDLIDNEDTLELIRKFVDIMKEPAAPEKKQKVR